jgi:hypothetical protein
MKGKVNKSTKRYDEACFPKIHDGMASCSALYIIYGIPVSLGVPEGVDRPQRQAEK